MEICIAVADWARGPTAWVPGVPGGSASTGARRKRPTSRHHGRRSWAIRSRTGRQPGVAGWAG
ncbi:hypothetical protein E2651_21705 [Streptomyces sp. MZ04]|nr:hypothetical protein E2651_21705 [Streptomyces sp. MZ04]